MFELLEKKLVLTAMIVAADVLITPDATTGGDDVNISYTSDSVNPDPSATANTIVYTADPSNPSNTSVTMADNGLMIQIPVGTGQLPGGSTTVLGPNNGTVITVQSPPSSLIPIIGSLPTTVWIIPVITVPIDDPDMSDAEDDFSFMYDDATGIFEVTSNTGSGS